jgi:DNA-binding Lrp family transcriptional regulator
MTPKDQQLIDLLKVNAREPVASLARKLGVARSTVKERLRKLEVSGVISGYTVQLGQAAGQSTITAHVLLTVDAKRADAFIRELKSIPAVRGLYAIAGAYDYLAVIETPSTHEIDAVLDRIGRIDGVTKTESSIALSVKFQRS